MSYVGTNTLDVVIEPNRDRLRTSTIEANAQTSIPIIDVMLPSGRGNHLTIPQVNLSISGYEPDSLGTPHVRSPSIHAQEISIVPQLDGPGSLPMRDPIGRRILQVSRLRERESSQGNTYIQRNSTTRSREYREDDSDHDGSRRSHRRQRLPNEGRYSDQGGRPPD